MLSYAMLTYKLHDDKHNIVIMKCSSMSNALIVLNALHYI